MSDPRITGVGSLPHRDPAAAAAFVAETTNLPYLAQLPNRHSEERMLVQWGDGLCGCGAAENSIGLRHGEPEGPRHEAFGGAGAVLLLFAGGADRVKTQATGPVTMALGLLAAGHPGAGLLDCAVEGLVERIAAHLMDIRGALPDAEITLILDEPGLSGLLAPGFPISAGDARQALRSVLSSLPIRAGIHCCADTDWSVVASLRPAWISCDVNSLGAAFRDHSEALAAATWEDTRFIWGIVPVRAGPRPADLGVRLERVVGRLVVSGARLDGLFEGATYSPACGMAGLTEDQAEAVARTVREVAGEVTARG